MVDSAHHGIIGVAGAGVASVLGRPEMAVGFLLGSLLPDLDMLFTARHQPASAVLLGLVLIGLE